MGFAANKSFRLERGLYLEERKGAACYKARASIKGVHPPPFFNTETTDYARAERLARSWFRRLSADPTGERTPRTMGNAAKSFLAEITKPIRREYHTVKWNVISGFWQHVDLDAVTTPMLKEFVRWRRREAAKRKRNQTLTPHTLHKDFVTLRRILHHATEEGWLNQIPVFPKREKIDANPNPWLTLEEWKKVQETADARRHDPSITKRTRFQRQELYNFVLMMVHSCARVDELRRVRVCDCAEKPDKNRPDRPYLMMQIQGKTKHRKSIALAGAVGAYRRQLKLRGLPDDSTEPLFKNHHRDGFCELLEAAGLRCNAVGGKRNLKCLRCTGIMARIKFKPNINLKVLADNVGTSVAMLDQYYLKPLNVEMNIDELLV